MTNGPIAASFAGGFLDQNDPLSNLALNSYQESLNVNHTSAVIELKQAIAGFHRLNDSTKPKSFIFTGNALNLVRSPKWMSFGVAKNATAYVIESLADSRVYEKDGFS